MNRPIFTSPTSLRIGAPTIIIILYLSDKFWKTDNLLSFRANPSFFDKYSSYPVKDNSGKIITSTLSFIANFISAICLFILLSTSPLMGLNYATAILISFFIFNAPIQYYLQTVFTTKIFIGS